MKVYKEGGEALWKLSQKNHKFTKKFTKLVAGTKYVDVSSQICEQEKIWECSIMQHEYYVSGWLLWWLEEWMVVTQDWCDLRKGMRQSNLFTNFSCDVCKHQKWLLHLQTCCDTYANVIRLHMSGNIDIMYVLQKIPSYVPSSFLVVWVCRRSRYERTLRNTTSFSPHDGVFSTMVM